MVAFSNKAKWHFWHFGGNEWLPDQQNNVRIALIAFQATTPIKRLVLITGRRSKSAYYLLFSLLFTTLICSPQF